MRFISRHRSSASLLWKLTQVKIFPWHTELDLFVGEFFGDIVRVEEFVVSQHECQADEQPGKYGDHSWSFVPGGRGTSDGIPGYHQANILNVSQRVVEYIAKTGVALQEIQVTEYIHDRNDNVEEYLLQIGM